MGDATQNDMEKLFLLEVLVDNLFIQIDSSSPNLSKDLAANMADTCVMFQFLHYPPLVVCESDFIGTAVSGKDTTNITFKSGKSCFFSLRSPKGPILPVPFEIKVSVIRKMKEGVLPDKLELGRTSIDLGDSFTELLKQNTDENCDALPLSKIKKGIFEIKDESGRKVGSLTAFLRLSCFGKLIITQFSLNKEDEKTYLFKGTDLKQVCKEGLGKSQPEGGEGQGLRRQSGPPTRGPIQEPPARQGSVSLMGPQPVEDPRYPPGRFVSPQGPPLYDQRRPGFPADTGDWQTRVPPGPPMGPYGSSPFPTRGMPPQQPPAMIGGGRLCECPYPVPPSVMSKYAQRTERNMGLAPGEVGMQDDQVIFQLPLKKPGDPLTDRDRQADSQVYYKLTSAEETRDGVQKNTVNIKSDDIPGMATKAVSPVSGLPVDDGHDVFLLKIGKKCEGDKKRNLELELRTPKMKEPKPPMSDKDTQYLESDIPQTSKKGSKDKGKGKGDKKGKKGKK